MMQLTPEQTTLIDRLNQFIAGPSDCFIIKGCAGSGKTSLLRAWLQHNPQLRCQLAAPTGRAARILTTKTGQLARTVHSLIYRLDTVEVKKPTSNSEDPELRLFFPLKSEPLPCQVLVIDEASMLGNRANPEELLQFGSGCLLTDLMHYLRAQPHRTQIIFVGDPIQLPPVGEKNSLALDLDGLQQHLNLRCESFELTQVLRQQAHSGLLQQARQLREAVRIQTFNRFVLPTLPNEIEPVESQQAVQWLSDSIQTQAEPAVIVTYTNRRARDLNCSVRERLWGHRPESIYPKDWLVINKNALRYGLFNGDRVPVIDCNPQPEVRMIRLRGEKQPVLLVFREVRLLMSGAEGQPMMMDCRILENLLDAPERDLPPVVQRALLVDFIQRHPELKPNTPAFKLALGDDPWFNAVQVKYGYAMTCHKAQGGEWERVAVDFFGFSGLQNEAFFRWSYTALTRARQMVYLLNAPHFDAFSALASPQKMPDPVDQIDLTLVLEDQIRAVLTGSEIYIRQIEHLQYCERYQFACHQEQVQVDFWYNKRQQRTKTHLYQAGHDPAGWEQRLWDLLQTLP